MNDGDYDYRMPDSYDTLDKGAIEDALIWLLNSCGDVSLANEYLSSGNKRLEDAAISWGSDNGYLTMSVPGGSTAPDDWGSK